MNVLPRSLILDSQLHYHSVHYHAVNSIVSAEKYRQMLCDRTVLSRGSLATKRPGHVDAIALT